MITMHRTASSASVVCLRDVPAHIRALDTLPDPDYVDVFTAPTRDAMRHTPEEWVRILFSSARAPIRAAVPLIWRGVLGLRIERGPSPDHLLGWRIGGRGDRWLRLEATGPLMTAHLVGVAEDQRLSVATFVRYANPRFGAVWTPVAALHRQVGLSMMRRGLRPR